VKVSTKTRRIAGKTKTAAGKTRTKTVDGYGGGKTASRVGATAGGKNGGKATGGGRTKTRVGRTKVATY